nr:YopT-type cysteine protease domain-containing protein [Acidovorax sp. NCPPB 4044]
MHPAALPRRSPVIHGICASQPRTYEPSYAPSASGWAAKRSAAFDQDRALSQLHPGHPGACVIYSLLWMNDIARVPGTAESRIARLEGSTPEILSLNQQYVDRVAYSNQDPDNQEDPLLQTARAHGIEPVGNTMAVDILSDEEAAMAEISNILNRPGSSHLLWLGNLGSDGSDAGNHVIAAHEADGRCILFDPNLGEFQLRPSEVSMILREVVARNSSQFAIPEIFIMPMRP